MIMVISPSKRWLDDLAKQRRADERAAATDGAPAMGPAEVTAPEDG
jgi:hypothetical protein